MLDIGSPCWQDIPFSTPARLTQAVLPHYLLFFSLTPHRSGCSTMLRGKFNEQACPGRLIISWILSACSLWWGLTEGLTGENDVLFSAGITVLGLLTRLQLRHEVYLKHRFFGSSRVHQGRENLWSGWNEWHWGLTGAAGDAGAPCVHACVQSLTQHIQIEGLRHSLKSAWEFTALQMEYSKLPWILDISMNMLFLSIWFAFAMKTWGWAAVLAVEDKNTYYWITFLGKWSFKPSWFRHIYAWTNSKTVKHRRNTSAFECIIYITV